VAWEFGFYFVQIFQAVVHADLQFVTVSKIDYWLLMVASLLPVLTKVGVFTGCFSRTPSWESMLERQKFPGWLVMVAILAGLASACVGGPFLNAFSLLSTLDLFTCTLQTAGETNWLKDNRAYLWIRSSAEIGLVLTAVRWSIPVQFVGSTLIALGFIFCGCQVFPKLAELDSTLTRPVSAQEEEEEQTPLLSTETD
jgi:hypothetical protein